MFHNLGQNPPTSTVQPQVYYNTYIEVRPLTSAAHARMQRTRLDSTKYTVINEWRPSTSIPFRMTETPPEKSNQSLDTPNSKPQPRIGRIAKCNKGPRGCFFPSNLNLIRFAYRYYIFYRTAAAASDTESDGFWLSPAKKCM